MFDSFSKPGSPATLCILFLALFVSSACGPASSKTPLRTETISETTTATTQASAGVNTANDDFSAGEQPDTTQSPAQKESLPPPVDPREVHRERFKSDPFLMLDERENRGPRDLVIVAVGDVSQPATQWVEATESLKGEVFTPTRALIQSGELAFMNLENPMTDIKPSAKKTYAFNSPPERLAWYMEAGFNMFSLANNHIADSGEEGVLESIKNVELYAEKLGIPVWHTGAGENAEAAVAPAYIRLKDKDITVAFFSVGFSSSPRVARFWDDKLPQYIAAAREKADIVFLSVHAGKEYHHVPAADIQDRYRKWVDAGADLVVGHHPHSIQPVEQYKQGVIFYSLGNFVFGSRTVRHRKMGAKMYGILTRIVIEDGQLRGVEIVPTWVNNSDNWTLPTGETLPNANFTPKILTGKFADQFFEDFAQWTEQAGATHIERVGDVGLIRVPLKSPPVSQSAN